MNPVRVDLSTGRSALEALTAGQYALLSGSLTAMRDAAHERLHRILLSGGDAPFDLAGRVVFYVSPAVGTGGSVTSAGPTTASRMDGWLELLLSLGVTATIGKGPRSTAAAAACRSFRAPYLAAIGGAGAFYADRITSSRIAAWEDLGPEAVLMLEVRDFPVFTGIDAGGVSMFRSESV